jgi:hypothetical protein
VSAVTRTVWIVTAPIKAAKVPLGGFFLVLMHQELFSFERKMLYVRKSISSIYMVFPSIVEFIPPEQSHIKSPA